MTTVITRYTTPTFGAKSAKVGPSRAQVKVRYRIPKNSLDVLLRNSVRQHTLRMKGFHDDLRFLINECGMSRRQLGRAIGVRHSTVSRWLIRDGKRRLPINNDIIRVVSEVAGELREHLEDMRLASVTWTRPMQEREQ